MSPGNRRDGESEGKMGRRGLLVALGAATTVGLAGCQEAQSQSFEADPVVLSPASQESLLLGELARDSRTVERDALDGNVSASITSHSAVYTRAAGIGGK